MPRELQSDKSHFTPIVSERDWSIVVAGTTRKQHNARLLEFHRVEAHHGSLFSPHLDGCFGKEGLVVLIQDI